MAAASESDEQSRVFDLPTSGALARLRVSLEDARARTLDVSEPGRHLALIALDGTVEYALWLVGETTGAPRKSRQPNFAELMNAVRLRLDAAGRSWSESGRAGVDQLHRARNNAQHAAVVPDAGHLAGWADAAHAFVDSLLRAAFDVRVEDLVLALAVRDEGLRSRLTTAEQALDAGQTGVAFSWAWIAFERAVADWRTLRTGVTNSQTALAGGVWPGADDGVSRRLSEIEATLDIQPFATDMGEYFTLAGARAAQDSGWDPEAEDARRALRFAVGWIVRWEAFRSGYPSERWAAWQSRIEPPLAGDRTTPQILSASADVVQDGLGNRHWLVRAQIANIPEKGRGDWGSDIAQCFADAAREFDGDLRPRRIGLYGRTGWVGIELNPGSDPDVTAATLRRMVELADRRYGERRSEHEAREERRCALDRSWHELVAEAAPTVLAVDEVRWEVHHDGEHYFVVLTRADPSAAQVELLLVADILRSRGGLLAGAGMRHDRLEIDSTRFSDQAASEVREALAAASQEVIRRRELLRVENEQYRAFTMRLRAEFGLPEGPAGER